MSVLMKENFPVKKRYNVNPVQLSRACLMDLPTVYSQQGLAVVKNGFGRYVDRLEKYLTLNGYAVASAITTSLKEHPAMTMDGRRWGR